MKKRAIFTKFTDPLIRIILFAGESGKEKNPDQPVSDLVCRWNEIITKPALSLTVIMHGRPEKIYAYRSSGDFLYNIKLFYKQGLRNLSGKHDNK